MNVAYGGKVMEYWRRIKESPSKIGVGEGC